MHDGLVLPAFAVYDSKETYHQAFSLNNVILTAKCVTSYQLTRYILVS